MSQRDRIYIQTYVLFLTARVKKPNEYNWVNLKRLFKYLKGTRHTKLTITVYSIYMVRWWVDAFYNTRKDFKSHTGSMMSLGKVEVVSSSRKIKTESELVGEDDSVPTLL